MKPGIYSDITNDDYHRGPGISKSGLDLVNKSPMHYHFATTAANDNARQPTPAQAFGTAFHALLLEPEAFASEYAQQPTDAPRRPTRVQREAKKPSPETLEAVAFWDAFEAENAGRTLLDLEDWNRLHAMRDAVLAHPAASALLTKVPGKAEQSVYWVDPLTGELCRCRPDFWREDGVVVDVKTTTDASPEAFARSIFDWRYHVQAPFYSDGIELATGKAPKAFVFLAVETKAPHAVAVYVLEPEAIELGRLEYQRDLMKFSECRRSSVWPGYGDTIQKIGLPAWAYTRAAGA